MARTSCPSTAIVPPRERPTTPPVAVEEIQLAVVPVDPRDLLRGDYVILSYPISRMASDEVDGDDIEAVLDAAADHSDENRCTVYLFGVINNLSDRNNAPAIMEMHPSGIDGVYLNFEPGTSQDDLRAGFGDDKLRRLVKQRGR